MVDQSNRSGKSSQTTRSTRRGRERNRGVRSAPGGERPRRLLGAQRELPLFDLVLAIGARVDVRVSARIPVTLVHASGNVDDGLLGRVNAIGIAEDPERVDPFHFATPC